MGVHNKASGVLTLCGHNAKLSAIVIRTKSRSRVPIFAKQKPREAERYCVRKIKSEVRKRWRATSNTNCNLANGITTLFMRMNCNDFAAEEQNREAKIAQFANKHGLRLK